jgi:SAM-dependent methyltransferase
MSEASKAVGDTALKEAVRDFWDGASCGEVYAAGNDDRAYYEAHRDARYCLEPYIKDFARFEQAAGKDVLEIGVGMGADHLEYARNEPKSLTGVDLTPRAMEHTSDRLAAFGVKSQLQTADAEQLPFEDDSFDLVYSWGVLHHTPRTQIAIQEVHRVLRPGGVARIMIYHYWSITGYMLWARYGLLARRPCRSLRDIYHHHLESPGTKAYTVSQAKDMCRMFSAINVKTQIGFADLLQGQVGQRHGGLLLSTARALWPRPLIRTLFARHGLLLLIDVTK